MRFDKQNRQLLEGQSLPCPQVGATHASPLQTRRPYRLDRQNSLAGFFVTKLLSLFERVPSSLLDSERGKKFLASRKFMRL